MKKIITIVLAVALVFALSVSAFALEIPEESITGATSQNGKIDITREENVSAGTVYGVVITWSTTDASEYLSIKQFHLSAEIRISAESFFCTLLPGYTKSVPVTICIKMRQNKTAVCQNAVLCDKTPWRRRKQKNIIISEKERQRSREKWNTDRQKKRS